MELVVATRNKKKVEEIRRILDGLPVKLLSLDAFPGCPEVEEAESTFEGNAVKKARAVASYTGKAALADDSGLEVDALGGAPGIYSARYAGEGAGDLQNLDKLLKNMENVPDGKRNARFVCVLALAEPDGPNGPNEKVSTFRGAVEGAIGRCPAGSNGFGYDPVFYPKGPEGEGLTFAEMGPAEKDSMSHRGSAIGALRTYLEDCKIEL